MLPVLWQYFRFMIVCQVLFRNWIKVSGLHWLLLVDGEYADALMNFPGKINAGEGTLTGPMRLLPMS